MEARQYTSAGGSCRSRSPGAFIFIGNGVAESGLTHGVHTPHYDFNDEIIPFGVAYWVSLVKQELGGTRTS
jgi:hippurate hydrolase